MSWISLTETDLLTVMNAAELSALRQAALADGQADPVAPTLAAVTQLVRGYVAANRNNVLPADVTLLPARLKTVALDLAASRLPQRLDRSPSEGRRSKETAALRLLEAVAKGDFALTDPTSPDAAQSPRGSGVATSGRGLTHGVDQLGRL